MHPASGGARYSRFSTKIIRTLRKGCANRPFYHIVVMEKRKGLHRPVIEQLGTYDSMPNENNEKLVAFNFERLKYWIASGAHMTDSVTHLLGVAGFLPIHPSAYMISWRNRQRNAAADATAQSSSTETSTSETISKETLSGNT